MVVELLESLPSALETRREFLVPGFGLVQPCMFGVLGEQNSGWKISLTVCPLSVALPFEYIHESF